jgi:hypothetical protein
MLVGAALASPACALRDAVFGKPCEVNADCDKPYRCYAGSCVPESFPDDQVAPDAGPDSGNNDTCSGATLITLGVPVRGTTSDAFDDGQAPCGGDGAAERYYAIDLPAATSLVARLEPSGYDAALYALTGCGVLDFIADSCIDDSLDNFAAETLILPQVGPGRVVFAVDGDNPAVVPVAGPYLFVVEELTGCPLGSQRVSTGCVGVISTASMTQGRTNTTATLLEDGRVLVVGGRSGPTLTTTSGAEIFDPADDSFTATGPMSADRARHAAVKLADGRVWVAGGASGDDGNYTAIADTEIWDPTTGAFTPAAPLPSARDAFTATLLNNDTVLVVGGRNGATTFSDAHFFNPVTNTYGEVAGGLADARFGHTATRLPDGGVLIVGGRVGTDGLTLEDHERWDAATGVFTAGGSSESRGGHTATLLSDGRVLVAGGFERVTTDFIVAIVETDLYTVSADSWDLGGDLAQPRLFAAAAHLPGAGVLLLGGDIDQPLATVELFEPAGSSWIRLPSLTTPRLALTAVTLNDGRVLALGGDGGGAGVELALDSAELYGLVDP